MEIHISESHHGARMLQLMQELAEMEQFDIYSRLMSLNSSIYILDKNYEELEKFVDELTTNPKWDYLFMVENREALHNVSIEIVRRLHNFVSSALSLRDHALTMYNKFYKDDDLMPNYSYHANAIFGEEPLSKFVMNLRWYCQHYRSPHIAFQTSWVEDPDQRIRRAIILIEDLLSYDKWSALAMEYINDLDNGVDILNVTNRYRSKVFDFYDWFQKEQEKIHQDDLSKFKQKEGELLQLQIQNKLEQILAGLDNRRSSELSLFSNVFLKSDYDALSIIGQNRTRRADRAIELLEKRFVVSDNIRSQLHKVYLLPNFVFYGVEPKEKSLLSRFKSWFRGRSSSAE